MRKRWKELVIDWELLQQLDDTEIYGVCLTQRKAAILKALLTTVYWQTRWENLGISKDELEAEMAQLDYLLEGGDCGLCNMEFRDNPNDVCEVQYSNDSGETWTTMFRKDVCAPPPSMTIKNITDMYEAGDEITTNNTTYAGDIINVAPDWDYDPGLSEEALCFTIIKWVDMVCDFSIAQINSGNVERRSENDWLDDIGILLSELVMDIYITASGFHPGVLLAGAIAWASVQIVEAVWDHLETESPAYYQDLEARETIACFMYNQLRGSIPQWDLWSASLDNFDLESATDAEVAIHTTTSLFNKGDVDIYINYMMLMEEVNEITEYLPECVCDIPLIIDQLAGQNMTEMYGYELCHSMSLAYSNPGDTPAVCPGVLDMETQIYNHVASSIGGVGSNIRVTLPPNVLVVDVKVRWWGWRQTETSHGDKNAGVWLGDDAAPDIYLGGYSWLTNPQNTWQMNTFEQSDEEGLEPLPYSHLWLHNSMDRNNGKVRYTWIHIECIAYVP